MAREISLPDLAEKYKDYTSLEEIAYFSSQDLNIDLVGCVTEVLNADTADYISKFLLQHLDHYTNFCRDTGADMSSMTVLLNRVYEEYGGYISLDVAAIYRTLLAQEKENLLDGIISYGRISGHFYMLSKVNIPDTNLYALYSVDDAPRDMTADCIQAFLDDNVNNGCSTAGPWTEILPELRTLADDIGLADASRWDVYWFALNNEKCVSVWFSKDSYNGDEIQMKLEQRMPGGFMGPDCELICDEHYATRGLSFDDIHGTLMDICDEWHIEVSAEHLAILTDSMMVNFGLTREPLEITLRNAQAQTSPNLESYKEQCLAEALEENDLPSISMDLGREVVRQMGNGILSEPIESQFRACALQDHPEWENESAFDMASVLFHDYCKRLDMHESQKEWEQDR